MKKFLSSVLIVVMMGITLMGCSLNEEPETQSQDSSENTETAQTENTGSEEIQELEGEITFWHSFTQGQRLDVIQKAADEFMQQNPKVNIIIETYSWGDFYTKWTTGLASGNIPDISTALPGHVVEMIDAEALMPLNDVVDAIGRNKFAEATLGEGTLDGNNYSVPLYSHAQVMWYRKDLLDEAGIEVPTTWDEFYEAAVKLTTDDVYGISVPTGSGDLMGTRFLNFYVRSGGGSLLTEDLKANLTSDLAIDGIKYWAKLYNETSPKDSVNYKVLDQANLFYQGKMAFDFNSGFHVGGIANNSPDLLDDISCAPIPKINANDPEYGIETSNIPIVLWKNTEYPEIAKAFIEYIYNEDIYIEFLESVPVGMLPAIAGIKDSEKYMENETIQQFADEVDVISEAVGKGTAIGFEHGPSVEAGLLASQSIIENMFQSILVGGVDVETAAQKAEDELNESFEMMQ
ncbi:sugar ABC transporter substrate-binding protein [Vallitaleaceae bacterium 9-2]